MAQDAIRSNAIRSKVGLNRVREVCTRERRKLKGATTHVDFGFAYDGYAIFIFRGFSSCERDAKMCEHRALRRRKEKIRDESYGFDGGVSREVVAHG